MTSRRCGSTTSATRRCRSSAASWGANRTCCGFPTAAKSCDGCRVSAGLEKSMSSGQKIGHIMGCPPRLICRKPPASVASFVAHQTPMRAPGLNWGCCWETSSTIDSTDVPAKLFVASTNAATSGGRSIGMLVDEGGVAISPQPPGLKALPTTCPSQCALAHSMV